MVVLGLLHVAWYPVHWDHIPENKPELRQNTDSDRKLRMHWFPDGAERLMQMAEKQLDHQIEVKTKVIDSQ
jgi:hypothetical protein